jgi:peroxiredoxin Q/BCP
MAAKKRSKAKAGSTARAPSRKAPAARAAKTKKKSKSRAAAASKPSKSPLATKKATGKRRVVKDVPAAAGAPVGPAVGDPAPDFELTDHAGNRLSSADLAGSPYVLYFYPKDDTPGCTAQACGFRDSAGAFDTIGARVIGVSPDPVASHQRFRAKYGLAFSLLSDEEKRLATAYGVWGMKKNYGREYMGVVRSTFLIDASGVIRNAWRGVRVKGHVDEVQAAARALN